MPSCAVPPGCRHQHRARRFPPGRGSSPKASRRPTLPCHTEPPLVVWRLDRLGRSLKHPIETISILAERGVGLKSLTEQIGATTPGGKLVFHVFGALAEFERDVIRERTNAGLVAARARGRLGGRTKKLADAKQLELARTLSAGGQTDIAPICQTLGISRATLYRYLKEHSTASAAL